jgi:AcrR family transcriptional regulator
MAVKESSGASNWAGKPAPTRGPKPSLSTEQIARVAIHIADAEGFAAVTMQRLAHELGLTTMALYRYFPGKAEAVAMMIDSVAGPPHHFGRPSSSWKARLKEWAQRCLAIYQDHPWFLEATTTRQSVMGPNELSWMEAALALLAESGLRAKERQQAFLAIIGHVRGHATFQQIRMSSGTRKEWTVELAQILQREADRFPMLLEGLGSQAFSESTGAAFEFGLDCILNGILTRVNRR